MGVGNLLSLVCLPPTKLPQEHHVKDRKEIQLKRKPVAQSQPEFLALAVGGPEEVERLILEKI